MKTILERSIPVQQAFIRLLDGETHHVQRRVLPKRRLLSIWGTLVGRSTDLLPPCERNAKNMCFESHTIHFCSEDEVEDVVRREVTSWTRS